MNKNALSSVLSELRVSGAIVLRQAHPIPWSIEVPPGNSLRGFLGVGKDVTVVPFHIAYRGHFDLHLTDSAPIVVDANQLVMCANGQGHIMGSGKAGQTRSFEDIMRLGSFDPIESTVGSTEVVCGVFLLRNTKLNPLIAALPNLVKVDIFGPNSSPTMQQLHAMLLDELQQSRQAQSYMLERVLEMLYAESIRIYTESETVNAPNWLLAINDSRVGPAINFIHDNLVNKISIGQLAQQAALSPSRFNTCFRERVGVSAKSYITSQRLALAAQRLLESRLSIQEVAWECGYQSMPSFTKAFVKRHGSTPSSWRREQQLSMANERET